MLEVQNKGLGDVVVVVVVVISDDDEWDGVEVQTGPCELLAKMSSAILMTDWQCALSQTGVKLNQSRQKIKPLLEDFSKAKDKNKIITGECKIYIFSESLPKSVSMRSLRIQSDISDRFSKSDFLLSDNRI